MRHFSPSKDWKQRGYPKPGRKPDPRIAIFAALVPRGTMTARRARRLLSIKFLDQLQLCKDNATRRLLLGISK